ncbi:MAG: hypothetical protein ABL965_14955 [Nitrospira sp.]|nr:MAG: hypothetical protein E8D44_07550 [Nitrospira sp.]
MSIQGTRVRFATGIFIMVMATVLPSIDLWAAEEPAPANKGIFGDRFSLDAGMKFWVAKWQAAGFANGISASRTSDTTALMGPSVTGSFKLRDDEILNRVSVNFTWLQAGGFDFSSFGNNVGGFPGATDHTSATRRDYSVSAALSIWRGFGVFAGYYHMQQRFSGQSLTLNVPGRESVWISGPIVGVFGSGTVAGPVKAYGNLALGFYDEHSDASGQKRVTANAVTGYSGEMGLSLDGPTLKTGAGQIASAIQMGFRAQIININNSPTANNDVTWGPTFQVIARF